MKVKLPNGIEIEADEVIVNEDGSVTMRDIKTNADRPEKNHNSLVRLSNAQLHTYRTLERLGGEASVSVIADELEITSSAASQRMRTLMDLELVVRSDHGLYRLIEE